MKHFVSLSLRQLARGLSSIARQDKSCVTVHKIRCSSKNETQNSPVRSVMGPGEIQEEAKAAVGVSFFLLGKKEKTTI